MMLLMLLSRKHIKILWPIIRALFIAVVNDFVRKNSTPNLFLRNEHMLQNIAIFCCSRMLWQMNVDIPITKITPAFPIPMLISGSATWAHETVIIPLENSSLASASSTLSLLCETNKILSKPPIRAARASNRVNAGARAASKAAPTSSLNNV